MQFGAFSDSAHNPLFFLYFAWLSCEVGNLKTRPFGNFYDAMTKKKARQCWLQPAIMPLGIDSSNTPARKCVIMKSRAWTVMMPRKELWDHTGKSFNFWVVP